MSYYSDLVATLGPSPYSAAGRKPTDRNELKERRRESLRLTELIEDSASFSFLRLGDMDLAIMLARQDGYRDGSSMFCPGRIDGTSPWGSPGISCQHADRLVSAFERADYVDFHERVWRIGSLLPRLQLSRSSLLNRNPNFTTSYILLTWMETEFAQYCKRHHVGFCGAEVEVLAHLATRPEFLASAGAFWPPNGTGELHAPRENGRNLDANLDLLKADLMNFIRDSRIDTLFLSLGGAAKILCYELAVECGIRCIDFGAMLRAMCFLGSDGVNAARATHAPFYYRVPFSVVMDCIEAAFPDLRPEELLAKAHSQLILEVQRKEIGWTAASRELDLSPSNRQAFQKAHREYLARYSRLFNCNSAAQKERSHYKHFCGVNKLTLEGKLFLAGFTAKSYMAACIALASRRSKMFAVKQRAKNE